MTVITDLDGKKPIPNQDRYDRPHGDDCACDECLRQWTRLVGARYIAVSWAQGIPGTDLVIEQDRWQHRTRVWKRDLLLSRLKALAVVRLEPTGDGIHRALPRETLSPEVDLRWGW